MTTKYDAVIIGAGFAGLYQLHKLRDELGMHVRVLEAADGVGGTWYWNRYPGARCDVESHFYSYSFNDEIQQSWRWSEKFASQPEILSYIQWVAEKLDLERNISFNTRVTGVRYEDEGDSWAVTTETGETLRATYVICAVGSLSSTLLPDIPGIDSYQGEIYHTGNWPMTPVAFDGQRVGVVGTGSSGIQVITEIARDVEELVVFQRTPNYVVPARNRRIGEAEEAAVKADYSELRRQARGSKGGMVLTESGLRVIDTPDSQRREILDRAWELGSFNFTNAFTDTVVNESSNEIVAEYFRERLSAVVADEKTRSLLTPHGYPLGTKRLCAADGYYETFNRDNVKLVSVRDDSIEKVTNSGIELASGIEFELDAIIFATGFDAITGSLLRLNIEGRAGRALSSEWAAGPHTYLGIASEGFPNLFFITGPGSPSVISNVVQSIEQHVDWVTDLISYARRNETSLIETTADAQHAWVKRVNDIANLTLYPRAASWYMGANVPGKPRVFMPYLGGVGGFRAESDKIRDDGYTGIEFSHSESFAEGKR